MKNLVWIIGAVGLVWWAKNRQSSGVPSPESDKCLTAICAGDIAAATVNCSHDIGSPYADWLLHNVKPGNCP